MPYRATLRTARMQLVLDDLMGKTFAASTGSATAPKLYIGTNALSGATGVLAVIPLSNPPFSLSGDVLTLLGVPITVAATGAGIAAKAELRRNDGTTVIRDGLTVGTSGTNVIIGGVTNLAIGDSLKVESCTITHP